jgi:transcription initiation factor TFIIIB Brf1 subunit/transcription initiation factor TFIIB
VLLTPEHYISRFVSYLQPVDVVVSSKLEKDAVALARKITDYNILPGRSALTISAAAIYYKGLISTNSLKDNRMWLKRCSDISTVGSVSLTTALKLIRAHNVV